MTPSDSTPSALPFGIEAPGHRLPAAAHIGRVRLAVGDLGRSIAWYEAVLGFRVRDREGDTAVLAAHGDETPLIVLNEEPGARPVPRRGRLGLFHFAILLPARADLGRFLAHLAALDAEPGMADHAVSEALYLSDPDGLGIEVYADRPRATWRIDGRQLHMTTAPLDIPDLLAAGRDAQWTGMPRGTTIGHVHLHVGDLDAASAFYHDALGFDKMVWSYPGALFLSAGGYHHHLGTNTWAARAEPATSGDARLLEWELVLPADADVRAAARSLGAAGWSVADDAGSALAADPWGTRVRLVASS